MKVKQFLKLRGLNIFVKKIGAGDPVICLHGGPGGEHRFFLPHLEPLAQDFQLVLYDQRGCGLSEPASSADYTMAEEVETLEELRKQLGIDKLKLIGESWGSMLALLYAVKYPDHVEKLLLTAAVGATAEGFEEFKNELLARLSGEDRDMLDLVMEKMETEEAGTKELFRILDPYYVHSVDALARKTKTKSNAEINTIMGKDITEHYNLKSKLHRLADIPVLVVQGESDMLTPEKINELLMQYLPNAKLTVIKECGHWTVVEKPGEFIEIVRGFFR
ncbi:alpha/beta fold hydrolase [Neobacillus vireti]|uniref:Proline iminopeptidase n=1 Tax=Neobacillus vireti LMG 21834 TaxID=1131730 RepID=A0AB94IS36_9BACI|nr:alpha/beta hydrolase [Neobacillus vireti]ETI69895.1 proline iminopeptidase [Neobacillus vireti LMG 21834]KLT18161.1 proline iminopeptidase [Neobacillus vireti]